MKDKEQRPAGIETQRGSIINSDRGKDTPKLTYRQRKVYRMLREDRFSSTDITIRLGYCHPASYIRALREKGINVQDEWVENEDTRYKKYWI